MKRYHTNYKIIVKENTKGESEYSKSIANQFNIFLYENSSPGIEEKIAIKSIKSFKELSE